MQFQVEQKVKATIAQFHNMFINGIQGCLLSSPDSWEFDGLDVLLTDSDQEVSPDTPSRLHFLNITSKLAGIP